MSGGEMQFDDMFGAAEEPAQRVHDDIEDEEEARTWLQLRATASKSDVLVALRKQALAQRAVQAVRRAVARLIAGSFAMQSLQLLGQRLSAHYGMPVVMRTAAASATPHNFSGNNRPHRFLVCYPMKNMEVIIDPAFRRQFELGASTQQYRSFLSACVPEVFVGMVEMLTPLVSASASAALVSFGRLGMPLPPWRCADKLLARWLPAHPHDTSCDALSAMANEQQARKQPSNATTTSSAAAAASSASCFRPASGGAVAASRPSVAPMLVVIGFDLEAGRRVMAVASLDSIKSSCSPSLAVTTPAETSPADVSSSPCFASSPTSPASPTAALPLCAPTPPASPASVAEPRLHLLPAAAAGAVATSPPVSTSPLSSLAATQAALACSPLLPRAAASSACSPSPDSSLSPSSSPVSAAVCRPVPSLPLAARLPPAHQSSANLVQLAKQQQRQQQGVSQQPATATSTATSRSLPISSQFLAKTLSDAVLAQQSFSKASAAPWLLCRKAKATRFAVKPMPVGSLMPSLRLVQIGA